VRVAVTFLVAMSHNVGVAGEAADGGDRSTWLERQGLNAVGSRVGEGGDLLGSGVPQVVIAVVVAAPLGAAQECVAARRTQN
jgi:hypothetical protein